MHLWLTIRHWQRTLQQKLDRRRHFTTCAKKLKGLKSKRTTKTTIYSSTTRNAQKQKCLHCQSSVKSKTSDLIFAESSWTTAYAQHLRKQSNYTQTYLHQSYLKTISSQMLGFLLWWKVFAHLQRSNKSSLSIMKSLIPQFNTWDLCSNVLSRIISKIFDSSQWKLPHSWSLNSWTVLSNHANLRS